jgi:hypothetical protein
LSDEELSAILEALKAVPHPDGLMESLYYRLKALKHGTYAKRGATSDSLNEALNRSAAIQADRE